MNKINELMSTENGWYSHRKILVRELNKLDFEKEVNILEFGTGYGSAEIFFEFCKNFKNLNVTAYDNNLEWLTIMKNSFQLNNYNFVESTNWSYTLKEIDYNKKYDLIFVDQSPWEARISTIEYLKDKGVSVIILHDYDQYNVNDCNNCKSKVEGNYLDVGEGSFFERFIEDFDMETCIENKPNWPPTLILKNKKI